MIVNDSSAALPVKSSALHVTTVSPMGNVSHELWSQSTSVVPFTSSWVVTSNETVAPSELVASSVMSSGIVIRGNIESSSTISHENVVDT